MPALMRVLLPFQRPQIEAALEVMLAMLDVADGDPDAEDATDREDDFALSDQAKGSATGPGCIVSDGGDFAASHNLDQSRWAVPQVHNDGAYPAAGSPEDAEDEDPAEDDDQDRCLAGDDMVRAGPVIDYGTSDGTAPGSEDDQEPATWLEWQSRGRHKLNSHGGERMPRDRHGNPLHDDAENVGAEDDFLVPVLGKAQALGPGCPIADPAGGEGDTDRELDESDLEEDRHPARRENVDRIRRTRCETIRNGSDRHSWRTYRLRDPDHIAVGFASDLRQ